MGGGISAAAAAHADGQFAGLILSSPMIAPKLPMPPAAALALSRAVSLIRNGKEPIAGYHPFDGSETFENSAGLSPARFDWYLNLQKQNRYLQTCHPTFKWVGEAVRLQHYLLNRAPALFVTPVLLCQSGRDSFVDNAAQLTYIKRQKKGRKELFPEAKHEIYRSREDILQHYYDIIFDFIDSL